MNRSGFTENTTKTLETIEVELQNLVGKYGRSADKVAGARLMAYSILTDVLGFTGSTAFDFVSMEELE
ncbi:MAG: hypothetical protein K6C05_02995 [Anaerovibrio sp.]|uniref:hypothetical protein n=1 Tax=Anaerovibrio sp. TaxID=1872532 RepID=UPI0025DFF6E2|nr:hypothetical protein [Anaerovibrio sp.]MCR5175798.1 hypothetical protein [Anaerovibrio sp.]